MKKAYSVWKNKKEKAGLKAAGVEQRKEYRNVEQFCILLCVRTCVILAVLVAFVEQFLSVMTLWIDRSWFYPALGALVFIFTGICMSKKSKQVLPVVFVGYILILLWQRQGIWTSIQMVNQQLVRLREYSYATAIWEARRTIMIQSLQQGLLAVMVVFILLLTVVMVWGKGRIAAGICMLFPMTVIAIVTSFPSKQSFWGMIITGGVYFAVSCCRSGIDGLKVMLASGSVLVLLSFGSDFAGQRMFAQRMEEGSTYLQARQSLQSLVDRIGGGWYARYIPGSTDHLKEIERFEPETGIARTVVVDTQPTEPVYYRERAGGEYTGEEWRTVPLDTLGTEEMFLAYPTELERLETLCTAVAGETESIVSAYIEDVLSSRTRYVREPGPTPKDRDFAEYFLFQNQKGFCVHYATAATLMYRICGIPARYVTGYRIPAENFHQQEDGTWSAEALGTMGHAWSEIYTGDAWKVKEHTNSPAQDALGQDQENEQHVETQTETSPEEAQQEMIPQEETETPESTMFIAGREEDSSTARIGEVMKWILMPGIGLVLLWCLLCLQCRVRYLKKRQEFRKRRDNSGIQRIYRNLYEQAVFAGMETLEPLDWQTVQKMGQYSKTITAKEWEWIYHTVQKALFSGQQLPVEDIRRMGHLNHQYGREIYEQSSRLRQIIYRWIRCL